MIRISTIFVAICMVLVAASLGLALHAIAGLNGVESAVVALAALTFMILYNAVSMRLRDRTDVGSQIADLSRGTADLARQVAEFGRRLAAVEGRLASVNSAGADRVQSVANEISELGVLVKELAESVASHEEMLASGTPATPPATAAAHPVATDDSASIAPAMEPGPAPAAAEPPVARTDGQMLAAVRSALDDNRIEIFLQPIVTLPQRKVRYYEAVMRLRDDGDRIIVADDFLHIAEAGGLIGRIDHSVMLRCIQVLRRLMVRNKDVGIFCNMSAVTLGNAEVFTQCLDFLDANRALASSFVLEFKQSTFRNLGRSETDHLAALAQRGFRFSIDHVADLRLDPRELGERGVRFVKVPAALLLDPRQSPGADIHPSDLSDLLGRFGIDLIAERIEGERAVVDLLDFDVRFGQGFLFAPPRPLRPEGASATGGASTGTAPAAPAPQDQNSQDASQPVNAAAKQPARDLPAAEPGRRATGTIALARRIAGPG